VDEPFPPAAPRDPARCLIMLVDDEADIRTLIDFNLKREGFRTIAAVDGKDALAKLEPDLPDLIFLDLMMPGHSGYEFLRHLQGTHPGIPVVVATARSFDESTIGVLLQEANVIEFFAKPFRWPLILGAIHKRLGTARPSPRVRDRPET
jgi:two-component system phosphate regulon response regulator PhoB